MTTVTKGEENADSKESPMENEDEPSKQEDKPDANKQKTVTEGEENAESKERSKENEEEPSKQEDKPDANKQKTITEGEENAESKERSKEIEDEPSNQEDKPDANKQKVALKKTKSEDDYRLRNVFARPQYAEPKHPIFSSPFARHISAAAFGPKKPKWYTPLTSAQLYLFKDIMNYVEIGREGVFRFDDFLEALQDFDSSITREEVVSILDSMEKNEFEELDFGKFLFLLAYRDQASEINDKENIEDLLSAPTVTPRQCLILSAISYYVLIASPEEIERYYIANTRRKATILHYHMEASRLGGLTEKQMEEKQRKAMEHLGPLFAVTGSPYAIPVPFVPRFKKTKVYNEWTKCRASIPIPAPRKPSIKPAKRIRDQATDEATKLKDDKTFYDMHYGRLPMPLLKIPEEMRMEMRKKCTVELKDYITRKAYEAIDEYRQRLKKATVLYNNRSLDIILKKGFRTEQDMDTFIEIFERYMPLKEKDIKNFSLWVKPLGYEVKHHGKPLYPDKFAFGSKIP